MSQFTHLYEVGSIISLSFESCEYPVNKKRLAEQQSCEFSIINYYYYVFISTEAGLYFAYTHLS